MMLSGLDRIAGGIDSLRNRGGIVNGAVGIDDGITSYEALSALGRLSLGSTIVHTVSGYIYHPKLYLINSASSATAIVGSANLTQNGLFRNVEFATAISLDFYDSDDYEVYHRYLAFLEQVLNPDNPNVQSITEELLEQLETADLIQKEVRVSEPGPKVSNTPSREKPVGNLVRGELFPPLSVPTAPPRFGLLKPQKEKPRPTTIRPQLPIIPPPVTIGPTSTFVMRLSQFDSSHRTGRPGTPEVLIPLDAQDFFPPISITKRKYADAFFDVVLNHPYGRERHSYRVWFYTIKDEFRLRMNHVTIDLTSPNGNDLLVINRLPDDSDPQYEVTILPTTDPTYGAFLAKCNRESQGKLWGIVNPA